LISMEIFQHKLNMNEKGNTDLKKDCYHSSSKYHHSSSTLYPQRQHRVREPFQIVAPETKEIIKLNFTLTILNHNRILLVILIDRFHRENLHRDIFR